MTPENTPDKAAQTDSEKTKVGNYFVANYPPFSYWRPEFAADLRARLAEEPEPDTPLGIYLHIPFCRKRCDFCYFRVYTNQDAARVMRYLDALIAEMAQYAKQPLIRGRKPELIYFGGGTPSYLSVDQLSYLWDGLAKHFDLSAVREVTFECEPGTLQEKKIRALREFGVTRLSLGVENFNPKLLELNNRAHRAKEIDRAYAIAREVGYPQINIDLIAGMVGETDENWQRCIERVVEMSPDSVTIYQMEVPYNTTIYRRMKDGGEELAPIADWETKRRWADEAFSGLEKVGYHLSSGYTAAKEGVSFLYRDKLWHGADMLGLGVSSFSHLGGVHVQNIVDFDPYVETLERGEMPLSRALALGDEERLIREFVLQLKLGRVGAAYFKQKFGVDILVRFQKELAAHAKRGFLDVCEGEVVLTREGLMRVDRLLPAFFKPEHVGDRVV